MHQQRNNWTISNNRIYQTATRTFTSSGTYAGVNISSSGNFFTISGNIIGFGAANGTGTTTIAGVSNLIRALNPPAAARTATSVQGNIISGFTQTSSRFLPIPWHVAWNNDRVIQHRHHNRQCDRQFGRVFHDCGQRHLDDLWERRYGYFRQQLRQRQ